jgi:hypothetical protein
MSKPKWPGQIETQPAPASKRASAPAIPETLRPLFPMIEQQQRAEAAPAPDAPRAATESVPTKEIPEYARMRTGAFERCPSCGYMLGDHARVMDCKNEHARITAEHSAHAVQRDQPVLAVVAEALPPAPAAPADLPPLAQEVAPPPSSTTTEKKPTKR